MIARNQEEPFMAHLTGDQNPIESLCSPRILFFEAPVSDVTRETDEVNSTGMADFSEHVLEVTFL
jgi:hypothetical protein